MGEQEGWVTNLNIYLCQVWIGVRHAQSLIGIPGPDRWIPRPGRWISRFDRWIPAMLSQKSAKTPNMLVNYICNVIMFWGKFVAHSHTTPCVLISGRENACWARSTVWQHCSLAEPGHNVPGPMSTPCYRNSFCTHLSDLCAARLQLLLPIK